MKAADAFANPTTTINQFWQTDFTYPKILGRGWFYLSPVLDDFSRYIDLRPLILRAVFCRKALGRAPRSQ